MPTSLMAGLNNSQLNMENPTMFSPSRSVVGNQGRGIPQTLTNTSILSLRQQMDESNHEMVNTLTQQLGIVINPLIQNTNDSYQMLTNQMSQIADFFGAPHNNNQFDRFKCRCLFKRYRCLITQESKLLYYPLFGFSTATASFAVPAS
jgi:hypothetical protein